MKSSFLSTIVAGFASTLIMTLMMYFIAPMMLGKPMDVAAMLGSMMGGVWTLGLATHFMLGTLVFPAIFRFGLQSFLPGPAVFQGMLWGIGLWLMAQVLVMPMMGAGLFSANAGGIMAVIASLMGHLVYGGLLGFLPAKIPHACQGEGAACC